MHTYVYIYIYIDIRRMYLCEKKCVYIYIHRTQLHDASKITFLVFFCQNQFMLPFFLANSPTNLHPFRILSRNLSMMQEFYRHMGDAAARQVSCCHVFWRVFLMVSKGRWSQKEDARPFATLFWDANIAVSQVPTIILHHLSSDQNLRYLLHTRICSR